MLELFVVRHNPSAFAVLLHPASQGIISGFHSPSSSSLRGGF
jgi:hypothetical protein